MVELCFGGGLVCLGGVHRGYQHLRIDTCLDCGQMSDRADLGIMQDTLWDRKCRKATSVQQAEQLVRVDQGKDFLSGPIGPCSEPAEETRQPQPEPGRFSTTRIQPDQPFYRKDRVNPLTYFIQ